MRDFRMNRSVETGAQNQNGVCKSMNRTLEKRRQKACNIWESNPIHRRKSARNLWMAEQCPPPRDGHVLIPGTCTWQKGVCDVIK